MSELKKLINPHIESYNHFIEGIPVLLENIPPLVITYESNKLEMIIEEIKINKPFLPEKEYQATDRRLLPRECRNRFISYKGKTTIKYKILLNNKVVFEEEKLAGYLPIMLKSKLCHLTEKIRKENPNFKSKIENQKEILESKLITEDKKLIFHGDPLEDQKELGGYFIINGLEKMFRFLVVQKRNFIFAQNKLSYKKQNNLTEHFVFMRCVGKDEIASMTYLHYSIDGNIFLRMYIGRMKILIPIVLILKGLIGICDEDLFKRLLYKEDELLKAKIILFLRLNLIESLNLGELKEINYIQHIGSLFKKSFYINTGNEYEDNKEACKRLFALICSHLNDYFDKSNFLIEAIIKLLKLENKEIEPNDSDDPSNHELIGINHMLSFILRDKLLEVQRNLKFSFEKKKFTLTSNSIKKLTKNLDFIFCSRIENFLATGNYNTLGCSDVLQETGFIIIADRINFLRFISHFRCVNRGSFFTTVKTTAVRKLRGESYGFLCPVHTPDGTPCGILNHLSLSANVIFKKQHFPEKILNEFGVSLLQKGYPVFLDGKLIGYYNKIELLAQKIREIREGCVEVVHLPLEGIFIFTSIGRYSRPVKNDLTKKIEEIGIMEQLYIPLKDLNELNHGSQSYSEVSKIGFLSLTASLTPFSDHNQSPRNMYQCQMAKQSMGISSLNLKYRNDSKTYLHFYNQVPIVQTENYKKYELYNYPIGVNTIIAVLSYTAYDMEDAMVINKSSMERGLFKGFVYKTEIIELSKGCHFYSFVEENTFLKPGEFFYSFYNENKDRIVKTFNGIEGGIVEQISVFNNQTEKAVIKLRIERSPNIGDKFCSRHGQKGVCSFHYPCIDMPFSESGLVPDVIINPHAFPSRMTVGMLIEILAGKSGCLEGKVQDGTPFNYFENGDKKMIDFYGEELKKCNFNYFGKETMYSGVTGNQLKMDIFVGVVYYQRLRHMVNDKFQVRIQGPVQAQTKQPIKGRSKLGGVRLGEMERDALLAHGTPFILQDRLMNCSDKSLFYYCGMCRSILFSSKDGCSCGNKVIKEAYMPYVFKYLCTELMGMNVKVNLE